LCAHPAGDDGDEDAELDDLDAAGMDLFEAEDGEPGDAAADLDDERPAAAESAAAAARAGPDPLDELLNDGERVAPPGKSALLCPVCLRAMPSE
jgi:hypothetical protein